MPGTREVLNEKSYEYYSTFSSWTNKPITLQEKGREYVISVDTGKCLSWCIKEKV